MLPAAASRCQPHNGFQAQLRAPLCGSNAAAAARPPIFILHHTPRLCTPFDGQTCHHPGAVTCLRQRPDAPTVAAAVRLPSLWRHSLHLLVLAVIVL